MKTILIAVLTLFTALASSAQSPSKILKQAEKALGGKKAMGAVMSVTRSGTIKRVADGALGKYELKVAKPDLYYERLEMGDLKFEVGFNGRSGWSRNSLGSEDLTGDLSTLRGKASSDVKNAAGYRNNLWLIAGSAKSKVTSGGQSLLNGKSANVVILTSAKGAAIRMYFDTTTGFLIRDEVPDGDNTQVAEYEDYRTVGATMLPFFERLTTDGTSYEIRFDDTRANVQMARSEFDFPTISSEPLPDIPTLLKELQANEDRVDELLDHYAYTQKAIDREIGKDGALRETESETTQISFYKGNRIARQVEKNGKPLSSGDQEKEDKDAAKRVEEIDKKIAKQQARAAKGEEPADEDRRISIAELLRASKLLNPRCERFRGRDVIVFDFEPNPDFDMKNAKSMLKFFGKTAGVMWIDEKDKQVARIEAVLAQSLSIGGGVLAKLKKGAMFTMEKERIGDEIWLPSVAEINLSVRVLLVKGINVNQLIRYYDYRRFETEVKDAKVDEKKP